MLQITDRVVDYYPSYPGFDASFTPELKLVKTVENLYESFLENVLDLVGIYHVSGTDSRKIPRVLIIENLHRVGISSSDKGQYSFFSQSIFLS